MLSDVASTWDRAQGTHFKEAVEPALPPEVIVKKVSRVSVHLATNQPWVFRGWLWIDQICFCLTCLHSVRSQVGQSRLVRTFYQCCKRVVPGQVRQMEVFENQSANDCSVLCFMRLAIKWCLIW